MPGLPDGRSLLADSGGNHLDASTIITAVKTAVRFAAERGALLVLAFLGHGFVREDDVTLFLMAWDSREGQPDSAVNLGSELAEGADTMGVDGVFTLVDTCMATAAAPAMEALKAGNSEGRTRLAMLMAASASQEAYDLDFTFKVTNLLREGIATAGATLEVQDIHSQLDSIRRQTPSAFVFDGTRSPTGLWLAHNRQPQDSWSGTLDVEWVDVLTSVIRGERKRSHFRSSGAFKDLLSALGQERWVQVTGPAGSGKSTLMAALTRADLAGFDSNDVGAIVFCHDQYTLATVAAAVTAQLAVRLPMTADFDAKRQYARDAADGNLDAWHTDVIQPLQEFPHGEAVIGIDGLDQLDPRVRDDVMRAVEQMLDETGEGIRIITSTRDSPGREGEGLGAHPASRQPREVRTASPDPAEASRWLRKLQLPKGISEALTAPEQLANGSWLRIRLLLELASDSDPVHPRELPVTLDGVYDLVHRRATKMGGEDGEDTVGLGSALAAILAATSSRPVPFDVVYAALDQAGVSLEPPRLRDLLFYLRHVIVRMHPQTAMEAVRPRHDSYSDYLLRNTSPGRLRDAHGWILDALDTPFRDHQPARIREYAVAARPAHCFGAGRVSLVVPAVQDYHEERRIYPPDRRRDWDRWHKRLSESGLQPTHPDVLNVRHERAHWAGESGDMPAAISQYSDLVNDLRELHGDDDDRTLQTRGHLAHWTGELGHAQRDGSRMAAAADQYADLLEDYRRLHGDDDDRTLQTRGEVAHWAGESGDMSTAISQYSDLVNDLRELHGDDDDRTLDARRHLAHWEGQAGSVPDALTQYHALLASYRRRQGDDGLMTMDIRDHLAHWTGEGGAPASAAAQYEELLGACLRGALGEDALFTLHIRERLAHWTGEAGDPASAAAQLEYLLARDQRALGDDHPYTMLVREELALWQRRARGSG